MLCIVNFVKRCYLTNYKLSNWRDNKRLKCVELSNGFGMLILFKGFTLMNYINESQSESQLESQSYTV